MREQRKDAVKKKNVKKIMSGPQEPGKRRISKNSLGTCQCQPIADRIPVPAAEDCDTMTLQEGIFLECSFLSGDINSLEPKVESDEGGDEGEILMIITLGEKR